MPLCGEWITNGFEGEGSLKFIPALPLTGDLALNISSSSKFWLALF
jgi:hypothetical protein